MKHDLIDRQAAIIAICKAGCGLSNPCKPLCSDVIAIKEVPSANQWTPVSEGLPDEFETLCCDNKGNMLIAHPFKCEDSDTGYSAESDECYMYNVVATWISPPKPYKEKKNE